MRAVDPTSLRLALWGTFDIADFGDHLFPRIFELEMRRRLPSARIQAFSPLGHLHPLPFDGGFLVEPLGAWSPERLSELAKGHDLIAIGGGDIIHTRDDVYSAFYGTSPEEAQRLQPSRFFIEGLGSDLEASCPVAWHSVGVPFDLDAKSAARVRSALEGRAYVSVCDKTSRDRLLGAGVNSEIAVVPDSIFLADRVFSDEVLERRLAYLRGIESFPESESPLIVQGNRALLPRAADIGRQIAKAAELGEVPVVLLATGTREGDEEFTETIAPHLGDRVYRLPASLLVEDIVAALVNSRGFIGTSPHCAEIVFARGLPSVILDLASGDSRLADFAALVGGEGTLLREPDELAPAIGRALSGTSPQEDLREITKRIDSHFDALAELADRSAAKRSGRMPLVRGSETVIRQDGEGELREAFEARGRRLVEQRLRLGEEIERLEQELRARQAQLDEYRRGIDSYKRELDSYKRELDSYKRELDSSRNEIESYKGETARMRDELQGLLNSRSMRYTAPLRAVFDWLRRAR